MLAAHRDQENLVLSHQVPTKQAPKTPGSKYPKTPSRFGRQDENTLGGFGGKGEAGDGKLLVKGGISQNLITPSGHQSRAILGNKTTNAKTRTGQGKHGGIKDTIKEAEKNQLRQGAVQKPKQKPISSRKLFLTAQQASVPDFDEPEYAPPQPKALPYQSDVLPADGLTCEGLKKGNLFKGYYQHFCDPIDDDGVSRLEKDFEEEMATVLEGAIQRNEAKTDELNWNLDDIIEELETDNGRASHTISLGSKRAPTSSQSHIRTVSSRQAAAALALASKTSQPQGLHISAEKPLTSKILSTASRKHIDTSLAIRSVSSAGEAASRTSIGYAKGRSTSSVLHHRGEDNPTRTTRSVPTFAGEDPHLTITPALMRQIAAGRDSVGIEDLQPQFLSIFDDHDDMDLPLVKTPYEDIDEDEDFELKIDI